MKTESLAEDWHRIITIGKLVRKLPRHGLPLEQSKLPGIAHLCYDIEPQVQRAIDEHVQANRDGEVGGILLGEVYQEGEIYQVSVTDVLSAQHTAFGVIYLTFTSQAWLDIIIRRRARYADKKTVGWYHSHPGLGVFLSSFDRFIHRGFFSDQPWYIALVVDPISEEQGVFVWDGDQIVRCPDLPVHLRPLERGHT